MRRLPLALVCAGAALLASGAAATFWSDTTEAAPLGGTTVPIYQVDSTWPKPFPTTADPVTGRALTWIPGEVAGTCVDSQRPRVHRHPRQPGRAGERRGASPRHRLSSSIRKATSSTPGATATCCRTASTAASSTTRTTSGSPGNGDGIVQKYSHDGARCCCRSARAASATARHGNACGNSGANPAANMSHTLLNEPADMCVDPKPDPRDRASAAASTSPTATATIASSSSARTGTYLRQWGGVAGTVNNPVTDYPGLFASGDGGHPHCVVIGNDQRGVRLRPRGRPDPGLHQDRHAGRGAPGRPRHRRDAGLGRRSPGSARRARHGTSTSRTTRCRS